METANDDSDEESHRLINNNSMNKDCAGERAIVIGVVVHIVVVVPMPSDTTTSTPGSNPACFFLPRDFL